MRHFKDIIILTILETEDCTVKTTNGEWCHFPFYYKRVKYEECTTKDHNRPWCATVKRLKNKDRRWGNCAQGNSVFGAKLLLMLLLRKLIFFVFVYNNDNCFFVCNRASYPARKSTNARYIVVKKASEDIENIELSNIL